MGDAQLHSPRAGRSTPAAPTYRFATFAYHAAGGEGRHLDVGFKLHLFFWVKEVFLFQLPKYSPLGLERRQRASKTCGQWSRALPTATPTPKCDDVPMSSSIKTPVLSEELPWHWGKPRLAAQLRPKGCAPPPEPSPRGHCTLN